ncbi:ATP-binding protein [Fodinisporobacter ferrooxydans]|uniref:ATP-binding protein n=1 Tax=Fodinisporobacter ferrooxydans TaxID=2901836 RepID=A0ABY4CNU3_9BACL|nr:ATP-binding protein [Alicyclobacillaceae bacterium MYW30-H2]
MIRKKESAAILQSLGGGVVPRTGLEHVIVGRKQEIEQVLQELQAVQEGAGMIKMIIGDYGTGKSFFLSVTRHIALKMKFVTCDADFTPERRLYATDGKAVATYSELMRNMSTATRPDGGALSAILEKWISQVQSQVAVEKGFLDAAIDHPEFVQAVRSAIVQQIAGIEELVGGYDFAKVINAYFTGYIDSDSVRMGQALRWLRGEYHTKTEARQDLGVRDIIHDGNYYEYLKIMSTFVTAIGYSGLLILLDEAVNLYKITHPQSREKNYEKILSIYNDGMQGKAEHLYVLISGTPEFLDNERKGLFSYPALKSRLMANRFETDEYRDLNQPVIQLTPLQIEETFVLLQKIRAIHEAHYQYDSHVSDEEIRVFLQAFYSRPGAKEFLTPREILRDFIGAINLLQQHPGMDRQQVFASVTKAETNSSLFARFQG